jgi:hypothetical protein
MRKVSCRVSMFAIIAVFGMSGAAFANGNQVASGGANSSKATQSGAGNSNNTVQISIGGNGGGGNGGGGGGGNGGGGNGGGGNGGGGNGGGIKGGGNNGGGGNSGGPSLPSTPANSVQAGTQTTNPHCNGVDVFDNIKRCPAH